MRCEHCQPLHRQPVENEWRRAVETAFDWGMDVTAALATCRRCGIRQQTHITQAYLCQTCKPLWLAEPQPSDGLAPGRWVIRRGVRSFQPDDRPPCGTRLGYREHLKRGEPTCQACRDYMRPTHYGPRRELLPCGTHSAFNRHKKRGETPCDECYEGERIYQTTRVRDRRKKAA